MNDYVLSISTQVLPLNTNTFLHCGSIFNKMIQNLSMAWKKLIPADAKRPCHFSQNDRVLPGSLYCLNYYELFTTISVTLLKCAPPIVVNNFRKVVPFVLQQHSPADITSIFYMIGVKHSKSRTEIAALELA